MVQISLSMIYLILSCFYQLNINLDFIIIANLYLFLAPNIDWTVFLAVACADNSASVTSKTPPEATP